MPKPAFQFVDNIRCIAMLAIVTEHTSYLGSYTYTSSSSPFWAYLTSIQLVKFGTIAFFIIAGFLFAENNGNYAFFDYLKRRFDNVFKPWLIWSLVFLILLVGGTAINAFYTGVPFRLVLSGIWWGVKTVYLHSNYWFIANFFFCTTVLLLSKEILKSWLFGLGLFLLTSFYSINVHTEWIIPQHTTAIFGFVFFYWLGVKLNEHLNTIERFIKQTSSHWFILATGLTLFIAVQEASFLHTQKSVDPINTLRFSNIIFSVTVFLLLLKIRHFNWLSILRPRKTTYGIFLIHYILLIFFLPVIMDTMSESQIQQFSIMDMYKYQFTRFFLVYSLSFALVVILGRSKFSWVIGIKSSKKPFVKPQSKAQEQSIVILETEAA